MIPRENAPPGSVVALSSFRRTAPYNYAAICCGIKSFMEAHMEAKNSAGGKADGSLGMESAGDLSNSFSIFDSLEELRQAQTHEPPSASRGEGTDGDASLESVLNRYREWLNTLDQ
jgi:hypothetical protein